METTKRLSELDPHDRQLVGKIFGYDLSGAADAVIILRTSDAVTGTNHEGDEVPQWCNVLEGLSDDDLSEVIATFDEPVRLVS
jgi:hypothetical protein